MRDIFWHSIASLISSPSPKKAVSLEADNTPQNSDTNIPSEDKASGKHYWLNYLCICLK